MTNKYYCVILAGGKGRRLWPCSRDKYPKQFIDFFGTGKTQLQQTFERMARIVPRENILVSTDEEYEQLVRDQLPGLADYQILAEPIRRNTASSLSWANHRVEHLCQDACLVSVPADQVIFNDEAFISDIRQGLDFVATHDHLLTMGVKPTRPEPGYGYIQRGQHIEDGLYHVKSFTEKPDRNFAQMFMDSGEFYWNTGIFMGRCSHWREAFCEVLPPVLRTYDVAYPIWNADTETAFMKQNFSLYPNLSLDMCILEKCCGDAVMKICNFGWTDVGTWHGIYESMQKAEGDNVVLDSDVMMENCHGNVVKLPKGRMAVLNGLDGFIVAEKDNVLLVCKKEDSSALIRKYVNEVQMKKGEEYI